MGFRAGACAAIAAVLVQLVSTPPAAAVTSGNGVQQYHGFDQCTDPDTGTMSTWWAFSPYYWFAPYIGGSNMGCNPQPYLSAAYLTTLNNQGWRFLQTWVGPQAPCSTVGTTFSYDTTTARNQGKQEALSAYNQLLNLGWSNSAAGVSVVYDMEYYDASNSACNAAVLAFISGWAAQLHAAPAQVAGMYGTGSALNLVTSARLDFVWGADYSGYPSTSTINGLNSGYWVINQRFKQYAGNVWASYGGVGMTIDQDCANGPTSGSGYPNSSSDCL